jgi:hypothetical protein
VLSATLLAGLLAGGSVRGQAPSPQARPLSAMVDEPLGARYSLGMTLWHCAHSPSLIARFHDEVRQSGLTPAKLLPKAALRPPASTVRVLVEPELLGVEKLSGWTVAGDRIASGAGDSGPTVAIPLRLPRAGLYRLWVQYDANVISRGVTSLRIYRAGQEHLGPLCQPDEFYDLPAATAGPAWHDLLVDLPAGDLIIQCGHVTRWWHGSGGYDLRRLDCLYVTDEPWAPPPAPDARKAMREAASPDGIQWTATPALAAADLSAWTWWQLRPLSWQDAEANPKLFQLSRRFWQGVVDDLARRDYPEDALPDYRAPERQVVFNQTWNMVANPVRARRQIETLNADIRRDPVGYHYVWHDVASHIPGLREDGAYDQNGPCAKYGNWYSTPGCLMAGYGSPVGTVATEVPVTVPGTYSVWVLSQATNLSYTAPWFGKVFVAGREQFTYHHKDTIPSLWMKMGEVTVAQPGAVRVEFTLDGAGAGGTYRRIHTLFLTAAPDVVPRGTVRPPWTLEMLSQRAAQAGAGAGASDKLLLWLTETPYRPLSQEVWADRITAGDSWPYEPVQGRDCKRELLMARETCRAVQVGLRNLSDTPLTLTVTPSPLEGKAGSFPAAISWRVEAFVPYGSDRQAWTPFFLLRRPDITVPPLNVAGVWLTVDTHGVPAGDYRARVRFRGKGVPAQTVTLQVRVSTVLPNPQQAVLVDGWTQPHEGEAYLRDFVEHGMNVWHGEMSKADMQKWGIRQVGLQTGATSGIAEYVARLKALGLDYGDYFVGVMDEPGGTTEEGLKPYLDVAKAFRAADPNVRLCFNPSEAAELQTFEILAPYCAVWCPYAKHVFSPYYGNPEKKKIYQPKPWLWYTTPCLWDKTAREPGIRSVPAQPGQCVGVAFFALNYPWRDQWDTGYEHIADASTMGAVISRHGPVATIVWEQIREASQTANLAMLVRERLGVRSFDEVTDPDLQKLIREGADADLIRWLENHPR